MTREEFQEIIEGFEDSPFVITVNGNRSAALKFVKSLSDSVKVLSNGKPAIYKYDIIESMTFDIDNASDYTHAIISPAISKQTNDIDEARRIIWLHDFSLIDRKEQLKEAIHNTPLEKEWVRIQNMINDARKNHILSEKIKLIINQLEKLPRDFDCVEYCIMLGETFALDEDYANASFQYEKSGDYQNAAYYASRCGNNRNEYLLEIFRKWILSGKKYEKDVLASFFSLCHSMHRGRICAETIKSININEIDKDNREIVYYGLILVLSSYVPNDNPLSTLNRSCDNISNLLDILIKESSSEQYDPDEIVILKHAQEIKTENENNTIVSESSNNVGYIIKAWSTHGYIAKSKNDNIGVKFNCYNIISEELKELVSSYPQAAIGLKVTYKLHIGSDNYSDIATDIECAQNLNDFLQKKGINIPVKSHLKTAQEMLIPEPDGKTYSGYINSLKANYGFIYKEFDITQEGVFFHFSQLEERLKQISDRILGLKVKCQLGDNPTTANKCAINIQAAENIDLFLKNQAIEHVSATNEPEIVDEAEILNMLKIKPPTAALQEYATTNRPLHALEVLERSRNSFPYDKYVKHKIQLLQRTKSGDNELISLLNYAISTSKDSAYIAHNLLFLGQVQYRCKMYQDVVATINRLFKYERYMKSSIQYNDAVLLIAIAFYMLQDYANADQYANELLNKGAHIEEANRILNRTFATEENIREQVDEKDAELSLQFDSEVEITPFIEKLIDNFTFGSISADVVPSDFNPWSSDCSVELANDYIQRLIKYDKRSDQKNNPNPAIAIAKIQKWLIQQVAGEEKEEIEKSLRKNVSRALQIMSRNTLQQSGLDIRVNLFYRMQQYKMSIREKKKNLFSAYINAHYGSSSMNSLKSDDNAELKGTNHLFMMIDILCLLSDMEKEELRDEEGQIKDLCDTLRSQPDANDYVAALKEVIKTLNIQCNESEEMYPQIFNAAKALQKWLEKRKEEIRNKASSQHWDELSITLEKLEKSLLSEYECTYLDKVHEITRHLIDTDNNTQTAMKQNFLYQSKNLLDELEEKLQEEPTYFLYSFFADVLSIMNQSVLSMLEDVMSHEPEIESIGSCQVNLGLTDSKNFILPLEFRNHAPSVQARNFTLSIESITDGVSIISSLPMPQKVDEGEKYSQSLTFRLDNLDISQIEICVKVEYIYDIFVNYTNECRSCEKKFTYTITFREVELIKNRYRQYAQKQTVRDKSMFFGRDLLIDKLYDAISIKNEEGNDIVNWGNGVVLYGQRRSGKTSILFHLEQKIVEKMANTIVVNLGSVAGCISSSNGSDELNEKNMQQQNENMTLQNLYYNIIHGVKSFIREQESDSFVGLKNEIKAYEEENGESFYPRIDDISNAQNPQLIFNAFLDRFKAVAKVDDLTHGFRIVIIIDEFTYFNTAIENKKLPYNFMEQLKGLVSDSFITMVIAGQDNMVEFMEKYVNEFSSFQREWVTFLEKDASYKMVTEPIGQERIEPEAAEKLYRFTAGSPYLLMNICCELVDWMNENKIYKLAVSLLDDFLSKKYMMDYEFKEDLLEPQYKDAGRIEWTEKNKLVLGLISRQNSKKVSSNIIPWSEFDEFVTISNDISKDCGLSQEEMHEILERLVKRQVIETQEGYPNRFRIKIPLCREWILRRGGSEYGNK